MTLDGLDITWCNPTISFWGPLLPSLGSIHLGVLALPLLSPYRRFGHTNLYLYSFSLFLTPSFYIALNSSFPFNYFISLILRTTKLDRKIKGLQYFRKFLRYGPTFRFFLYDRFCPLVSQFLTMTH